MASSVTAREIKVQQRITAAIAVGTELETLLSQITQAAARLCRAPLAMLTVLTDNHEELEVVNVCGTRAPSLGARLPVATSLNGRVITSGRSIRSINVLRDPRPVVREVPQMSGARGVLCVPLRDGNGPFGTLGVARRTAWRFTDQETALLTQLADSASSAIQNAQLRNQAARKPPLAKASYSNLLRTARGSEPSQTLRAPIGQPPKLSDRQTEVLDLLIGGKTCKEIAVALGLSPRTVEHHVHRLKKHFHQPRLHALVGCAVAHGL